MMTELNRLKKENKELRALLKRAAKILDKYRDILKHPEKLRPKAKGKTAKK